MGRLDREPRPSREELEATLKFVAETDNLDGEAYTLAAEVRALREESDELRDIIKTMREELATLRDDVFEERHIGVMTISIPRVPDGDAGRTFLGALAALVKAAQDVLRSDLTGWTERQLRAALAKLGAEAPPEDESAMGEQCRRLDALVKAARSAEETHARYELETLTDAAAVAMTDAIDSLRAALKPFDD